MAINWVTSKYTQIFNCGNHQTSLRKISVITATTAIIGSVSLYIYYIVSIRDGRRFNNRTTADEAAVLGAAPLSLHRKVCIITGASSGIGKEVSRVLLQHGAIVVMACRNDYKATAARKEILESTKLLKPSLVLGDSETVASRLVIMPLDLSSLSSVHKFVIEFTQRFRRVNMIINNAGCICPNLQLSDKPDCLPLELEVNYIGPHYLVHLLTPLLLMSAKPKRVINVSSALHSYGADLMTYFLTYGLLPNSIKQSSNYDWLPMYGLSKLCNILWTRELNYRYLKHGIIASCVDPGFVNNSQLYRCFPFWQSIYQQLRISPLRFITAKTPSQGAAGIIRCASMSDDELQRGGHYYVDCNEANHAVTQLYGIRGKYLRPTASTDGGVGQYKEERFVGSAENLALASAAELCWSDNAERQLSVRNLGSNSDVKTNEEKLWQLTHKILFELNSFPKDIQLT